MSFALIAYTASSCREIVPGFGVCTIRQAHVFFFAAGAGAAVPASAVSVPSATRAMNRAGRRAAIPAILTARLVQLGRMKVTRNGADTQPGPAEWFTGSVFLDAVAATADGGRISGSSVHFTPGARTAWHTHPHGQTIFVTEGMGLAQRRGGPAEAIRPGDRVFFEPGEEHWHGAAPGRFMTHLAVLEVDAEGNVATWLDHVTDEEYANAAKALG
jgi:quercetin dioxygenase-like cupin family protein